MRAYLDHAATSPMRPEALAAMLPYLTERYGNPSGTHAVAREALRALDEARESVAAGLGCDPGEVVFTSGGTESDNLAVLGTHAARAGAVVCSAVEHHAVLRACRAVGGRAVEVDRRGRIDLDALGRALHDDVSLVSVMLANNEVGTIQPLAEVAELVRSRAPGALLHTDAVAAVGWLDVAGMAGCADLVSVSAHKFGGPKGAGALVVRAGAQIEPLIHGGFQERGRRAGTQDVAGIVGMAAALSVASAQREEQITRIGALRDRLAGAILGSVDGAHSTTDLSAQHEPCALHELGSVHAKLASSFHVLFEGVDSEELLFLLDEAGVCASAGSACASGAIEPSHVLLAMGVDSSLARSGVRFSLGATTTEAEIDHVAEVVPKLVGQLRH